MGALETAEEKVWEVMPTTSGSRVSKLCPVWLMQQRRFKNHFESKLGFVLNFSRRINNGSMAVGEKIDLKSNLI